MTTPKSGSGPVGVTGPVASHGGGTTGHLPAGYALREFQLERVVGEGGFSIVYLATDTRLERQVAIKEYMPTALATRSPDLSVQVRSSAQHREAFEAGLRSFINEAKLLARFEHRALVKVHQFWQDMGTAYMVMPYYVGPTLKHWIRHTVDPVDPTWLEQFLRLLMDALETLHRENCLHRDVAPDNILILNERTPLLLDFGAARRVIGDLTQALTVILKPGFAPIEQYAESQSMRQGPWTDVYALCAVAHFMITGRAPTPSVTRVLADDLVPLSTAAAGRYPAPFLAAIDAGLTVRPQQRPQSIAALRELMNGTAQEDHTLTAPPGRGLSFMETPATSTGGAVPTTIRPLTPTIAPPPGSHYDEDDDEKTRIATTRDFMPLRTTPATISQPAQPAVAKTAAESAVPAPASEEPAAAAKGEPAAADAAESSAPVEGASLPPTDGSFGARVPSRTMRELETNTAPRHHDTDDDKASLLPLAIGGVAIAVVIGTAWGLINWMNGEFDAARRAPPPSAPAPSSTPAPMPPPPPARKAALPDPAPASAASAAPPSTPSLETPLPKPARPAADPSVAMNSRVAPAGAPSPAAAPADTAAPAATDSASTKKEAKAEKSLAPVPAVVAKADVSEPAAAPSAPARIAPSAPTAGPTHPPANAETKSEAAATKSGVPANRTTAPSTPPVAQAVPAAQSEGRMAPRNDAAKSAPSSSPDPARARPTTAAPATVPAYEPQVAPPMSVPPVATVEAGAPPAQVAAVEPPRALPPPAAAAAPAPLRAVNKPDPMFPREALRADVDKGKVRARLFVASDGTVNKVEIVSAYPVRIFDREVRETAMRWRFDPPGQPRQTEVEFVFDRFKGR